MKIIALEQEKPGYAAADFQPHLRAEAAGVWQLVKVGIIRETYFNPLEHSAVLVLECASLEDARQVLAGLPLVQYGLISFELIPLAPYTGYERLFLAG